MNHELQNPNQEVAAEDVERLIQNDEMLIGYMTGLAAKQAIETGMAYGRPNPDISDLQNGNSQRDVILFPTLLGDHHLSEGERAARLAAQRLHPDEDYANIQSISLASHEQPVADASDDVKLGFLLGYLAKGPTFTSQERVAYVEAMQKGEPRPTGTPFEDMRSFAIKALQGEPLMKDKFGKPLHGDLFFPKHFGLREVVSDLAASTDEQKAKYVRTLTGEPEPVSEAEIVTRPREEVARIAEAVAGTAMKSVVAETPAAPNFRGLFSGSDPAAEAAEAERAAAAVREREAAAAEAAARKEAVANMDVSAIFSTPDSLRATLENPDTEPELKYNIHSLVRAWENLRASQATSELMADTIIANRGEFDQDRVVQKLDGVKELAADTQRLMTDVGNLDSVVKGPESSRRDQLRSFAHQKGVTAERSQALADHVEEVDPAVLTHQLAKQLGFSTDHVDERVERMKSKGVDKLSDSDLFDFIEDMKEFQTLSRGSDIVDATNELRGLLPQGWMKDRDFLTEVATIAGEGPDKLGKELADKMRTIKGAYAQAIRVVEAMNHRDLVKQDYIDLDGSTPVIYTSLQDIQSRVATSQRLLEMVRG